MIKFVRILGVALIVVGAIVLASWLIQPLRDFWPLLIDWFQSLPVAIQIGLVIAAVGFLLLLSSIIWERMEDRKTEGSLLDDD